MISAFFRIPIAAILGAFSTGSASASPGTIWCSGGALWIFLKQRNLGTELILRMICVLPWFLL
jgi:hypothetical protein